MEEKASGIDKGREERNEIERDRIKKKQDAYMRIAEIIAGSRVCIESARWTGRIGRPIIEQSK